MTQNDHERAHCLIEAGRVEGVPPDESHWLNLHLESCEPCAHSAASVERIVQALRSIRLNTNPTLVTSTQQKVRLRASEMRDQAEHMRPVWISCALSSTFSVASIPYLWRAIVLYTRHAGVSDWVWQLGLLMFWFLPSIAVIAVLVWQRPDFARDTGVG
jgi:anti-sigma factor RsiW